MWHMEMLANNKKSIVLIIIKKILSLRFEYQITISLDNFGTKANFLTKQEKLQASPTTAI